MSLKLILSFIFPAIIMIATFRALFLYKSPPPPKSCLNTSGHEPIKLDKEILDRFQAVLSVPTISYAPHRYESDKLLKLLDIITSSFPEIHKSSFIKKELVSNYTLLYTIEGSDESLRPYLLISHLDVVPAVRERWSSDPFEAVIKSDKFIYARGAMDAKHLLMAMLEALEALLKKGFKPKRSLFMAFGHDEEVTGVEGAQTLAKILPERIKQHQWDKFEYILDEGNIISETKIPGIGSNVALVGVAEKGYLSVKLSTTGSVGHGSMPPPKTAISKLCKAVSKFHSHLLPSFLGYGVERDIIEIFAQYSSWPYKLIYANFWLFQPIFGYVFDGNPSLNSLIRTTTAVTMISGGTKENVLPDSASAIINHRVHPLQTIDDILEFDKKIVDDPTISIETQGHASEPSSKAPYCDNCYGFQVIKQSILQVHPGTVVVPSVFSAASDSRFYQHISDAIYKFSAIAVPLEEMNRFHGHDERISLKNYENLINFFHHLIDNSDSEKLNIRAEVRDEL